MSLDWNYPGSWEDELLEAYGLEADVERIDYYRRLWDAPEIGDG
jgi:kanamycin kinase